MNKIVFPLLLLFLLSSIETRSQDFFDRTEVFMNSYVKDGRIAYDRLQDDAALEDLLYDIAQYSMKGRSREYKAAFYLNAYNLLVIDAIRTHWPVKNVLEIDGLFDELTFRVAGEELSLNSLENQKLRKDYGDNRVHFALVCGAVSCPRLPSFAFVPGALHDQLKYLTPNALKDPRIVNIDNVNSIVYVSRIFEWYKEDFENSDRGILNFIEDYSLQDIPDDYMLEYLEYDWSVNSQ